MLASKKVQKILSKKNLTQEDVNNIMDIMDELNIKDKCEQISKQYQNNIESIINKFPIDEDRKNIFNEISEFLINREN
jgi:geranylgeranyl pyrophosphate synthase